MLELLSGAQGGVQVNIPKSTLNGCIRSYRKIVRQNQKRREEGEDEFDTDETDVESDFVDVRKNKLTGRRPKLGEEH